MILFYVQLICGYVKDIRKVVGKTRRSFSYELNKVKKCNTISKYHILLIDSLYYFYCIQIDLYMIIFEILCNDLRLNNGDEVKILD